MKRRDLLASAGIGSAAVLTGAAGARTAARAKEDEHAHPTMNGPLANATVSFGEWRTDFSPPLDRFVATPNPWCNACWPSMGSICQYR